MADLENPAAIEKGQDAMGSQKPAESGAIPPGVMEKAREYGVQPGQWQQYGQHIQDEYTRIVNTIMSEYKLLDQVEQNRIIQAIESGDEHALDEVLLLVNAHLMGQDRELPHVLNNLKKVAAKKILSLAEAGKLAALPNSQQASVQDELAPVVEVVLTLFQTLNVPQQEEMVASLRQGDSAALDTLIAKLTTFGYQLESLDLADLRGRVSKRLLGN